MSARHIRRAGADRRERGGARLRPAPVVFATDGAGDASPGPYSYLLASSTDLGPSHNSDTQLTVALREAARPARCSTGPTARTLSVRWRPGHDWAVLEGAAESVADAFDVEVHDYRGQRGQVFYASPQQPSIPDVLRRRGRRTRPDPRATCRTTRRGLPMLPLDVPDKGLTPDALLQHLQRQPARRGRLYRQGRHDRLLRLRRLRPVRPRHLRHHIRAAAVHPGGGRRRTGRAARRDDDGPRGGPRRRTGCAQGRVQRAVDGRRRRHVREDRRDVRRGRPAVPRRGVELLDRLGLRQADHRRRPRAGAVRAGDGTVTRHFGVQRQRRPRRAGMQGRRRLVVSAGRRPISGWIRLRRCRR